MPALFFVNLTCFRTGDGQFVHISNLCLKLRPLLPSPFGTCIATSTSLRKTVKDGVNVGGVWRGSSCSVSGGPGASWMPFTGRAGTAVTAPSPCPPKLPYGVLGEQLLQEDFSRRQEAEDAAGKVGPLLPTRRAAARMVSSWRFFSFLGTLFPDSNSAGQREQDLSGTVSQSGGQNNPRDSFLRVMVSLPAIEGI